MAIASITNKDLDFLNECLEIKEKSPKPSSLKVSTKISAGSKNWYENSPYLQRIYETDYSSELVPFPHTWQELEKWFNCVDENVSTVELSALIKRIRTDDLVCKNNAKEFLAKHKILPKSDFIRIWKAVKNERIEESEEINYYDLRDVIINLNFENNTNIVTIRENDELCMLSNGVYLRKEKSFIETQISRMLERKGICFLPYKKQAIIDLIKTETYHSIKEFDANPELLNLKNGVLNLKTGEFREHDPTDLFFTQIPVKYDPNAKCPKIDNFLSEILKEEDIPFFLEYIGLCLTPEMSFQKALMLYGNGNNGKTTLLSLIVNLIGETNKSSVPLSQLNQPFEGAKLEKRLMNLVSDLDSTKMTIRFFKLYVGNEWSITINRKFKEPYDTTPTAKLIYSCNALFPDVPKDTDKGFFRKWILIECPNEFDNIENLKILDSLITKQELSGFLNEAIKGLHRLIKRGNFEKKYMDWLYVRKVWTEKTNPFNGFIEEFGKEGKYIDAIHDVNNQFWETKKYTLTKYNEYLEEKINVPPITQTLLTRIMTNHPKFSLARRPIKGKRQEVYIGFKLRDKKKTSQKSL